MLTRKLNSVLQHYLVLLNWWCKEAHKEVVQLLPRCLVCLPWAISFPVTLLVRSTVANASVRPCFKTWAVMSTSSPTFAAFI